MNILSSISFWKQAFALAKREMRGGLHKFGVFWGCLFLGVMSISAIGSFSQAARVGLERDARSLLGGDLEIRLTHRQLDVGQLEFLKKEAHVAQAILLRAMARSRSKRELIELKGIDEVYPLYGQLELEPDLRYSDVFAFKNGVYGAAVAPLLLKSLGIALGDKIQIGEIWFQVRAIIVQEPDHSIFSLGPRVILSRQGLQASGLLLPGSLVRYAYRLALYGTIPAISKEVQAFVHRLHQKYSGEGWRIRTFSQSAPRIRRTLQHLDTNLTLVGLAALLIGGLGIAGAVRGYIQSRILHIAIMKCMGASSNLLFTTYLLQVFILAFPALLAGLVLGGLLPWLLVMVVGDSLPISIVPGIYFEPLLVSAGYGLLVTLCFSLLPLSLTRSTSPSSLFRGAVEIGPRKRDKFLLSLVIFSALLFILMLMVTSEDIKLTSWFLISSILAFAIFQAVAWLIVRLAALLPRVKAPWLRLGIANIYRPGSPARLQVFSLGLGLTALVAVTQVEGNLVSLIESDIARQAPDFFFIDIQPSQIHDFESLLLASKTVLRIDKSATLRGRITHIAGQEVGKRDIDPSVNWAVRGDRALAWAAHKPQEVELVAGQWWADDYQGPPLISLSNDLAKGFKVGIGDTLTINVLGRKITGRIACIRNVRWTTLALQFAVIFSPGVFENAPQTWIAAVYVQDQTEGQIYQAVTDSFNNISAIRIKDVLSRVGLILQRMATVFTLMAGLVLLVGILVLAGSVLADQQQRIYDAVIFKVCGATSKDILSALSAEFFLVGLSTAFFSLLLGSLAAWAVVEGLMHASFNLQWGVGLATILLGLGFAIVVGLMGTVAALRGRPGPYLRNE